MANTTKTQVPNVNSWYDRNLLLRAQPLLVHLQFGQIRDIPRNNSDVVKFRRYTDLTNATTPLTEGITPTGSQLSVTTITAQISQYGDFVSITDALEFETEDPLLTETASILGDQAGRTIDVICRDILVAGTNVIYANNRVSRVTVAAADVLTESIIIAAEELLKLNNTRHITEFVDPTTLIDSHPLPPCYIGIVHTNITRTLRAMSGFTRVENYAEPGARMVGEVGRIQAVRFIETTNAKIFTGAGAAGIDVYCTLIFGQEAYGITRISGEAMRTITQMPGTNSDPLEQRSTMGWKGTFTAKILNDNFIVRLEHARV